MDRVSSKRHRFPPEGIRQAVWLYFRFTLSLRDVEEMGCRHRRGMSAMRAAIQLDTSKLS